MRIRHSAIIKKTVYICLFLWIMIVASCIMLYFMFGSVRNSQAGKTVVLTELNQAAEISVHAPVFPWCTGDMYILYEGVIDANAALEVVFNRGRDHETIPLQAGKVSGVYGGAEYLVDDLSVRFAPRGATQGILKITAICGRNFTHEEREQLLKLWGIGGAHP